MTEKRKDRLEKIIFGLAEEQRGIGIRDVAKAAGLSTSDEGDRKAIRRILQSLVQRGLFRPAGSARARMYIPVSLTATAQPASRESIAVRDIEFSTQGRSLLKYVSRPLIARTPVGYERKFLQSYEPNRTFYLSHAQRSELLQIGRVESKIQPAGTYARHILNRLLIDLSWNSSRLEGNTYSLLETQRLIELGENARGKDAAEAQMILNHKGAIEYMIESAPEKKITSHTIRSVHALLSENLLGDPSASGRLRDIAVGIGGSTYIPLENPHLLKDCFQTLTEKLNRIANPFEQSFFALAHLSYIQAFEDVNKRTARLVANIPLIKKNLKPLSFSDVDRGIYVSSLIGVYEKTDVGLLRDLYVWAYLRSARKYSAVQQAMGEPNLLKLQHRSAIHDIVRAIVIEKKSGSQAVQRIRRLMEGYKIKKSEYHELSGLIETEILSLHKGNIARYKIRPSEFLAWKNRR